MLPIIVFGALLVAIAFPETPAARALVRVLTDAAEWLAERVSWTRLLLLALVILAIFATVEVIGHEGIPILGAATPEILTWFVMFDVATWFDVMALAWTLAAVVRVKAVWAMMLSGMRRARALGRQLFHVTRRASRQKRKSKTRRSGTGKRDEDGPGWAVPFVPARPALA